MKKRWGFQKSFEEFLMKNATDGAKRELGFLTSRKRFSEQKALTMAGPSLANLLFDGSQWY